MKLSDWVAQFLADKGIRHVFAVTGGASLHLIDSIARTPGIDYVCPRTSRPAPWRPTPTARDRHSGLCDRHERSGATNLLTGMICSWFDSVPVLYVTGQVTTFRLKGDTGVRQMGFQETDIVDMSGPVTKYAVMVTDWPRSDSSSNGRCRCQERPPGPVLVDLPDDLQRMDIDPGSSSRTPRIRRPTAAPSPQSSTRSRPSSTKAERPVVILGWGVRLAGAEPEALALIEQLGLPALPTWPVADMIPSDHPCIVGPLVRTARATRTTRCRTPTSCSRSAPASTRARPAALPGLRA